MSENKELINQICSVLAEALHIDGSEVTAEAAFGDVPQWDSMGHMEVMMLLEEKFGVEINADTISNLLNVQLIFEHIEGMKNE